MELAKKDRRIIPRTFGKNIYNVEYKSKHFENLTIKIYKRKQHCLWEENCKAILYSNFTDKKNGQAFSWFSQKIFDARRIAKAHLYVIYNYKLVTMI